MMPQQWKVVSEVPLPKQSGWEVVEESPLEPQGAVSRFSERLAQSAGLPTTGAEFGEMAKDAAIGGIVGPAYTVGKSALDFGKNILQSGKNMVGELGEAATNISEGGPIGANIGKAGAGILDTYLDASPLGGQIVKSIGADVASGNYAGAAGSATGALIQAALLKAGGKASQIGSKNLPEIRANNLDVALSVGGRPKGVDVHAEVASPISEAYARKAQELGMKPKDFAGFGQKYIPFVAGAGRKIYQNGLKLAKAVKDEYAQVWNEKVIKPVENLPGKAIGESAIKDFREKLASDQELLKGITNTRTEGLMKKIEAYILDKSGTIGSIDAFRKKLNEFSADYFSKDEQGQLRTAFGKKAAAAADRAIRNAEYRAIEESYGPEAAGKLRRFQKEHGAAIEAFNMMDDAATQLSGAASREAALPPLKEQLGSLASKLTLPAPAHAIGAGSSTLLSPSAVRTFGSNMAKVIDPRGVKAGPLRSPVPNYTPRLNPQPPPPDTSFVKAIHQQVGTGQPMAPKASTGLEGADLSGPLEVQLPGAKAIIIPENTPIPAYETLGLPKSTPFKSRQPHDPYPPDLKSQLVKQALELKKKKKG